VIRFDSSSLDRTAQALALLNPGRAPTADKIRSQAEALFTVMCRESYISPDGWVAYSYEDDGQHVLFALNPAAVQL
jgi:hypothetical protein